MTTCRPTRVGRLDTCQCLLMRQINTADQSDNRMRHDAINCHLREDRLTSRLVRVQARIAFAISARLGHLGQHSAGQELLAPDRMGPVAI